MKCARHNDSDVVGFCTECGAGVCADCASATKTFSRKGVVCVDCVTKACKDRIAEHEKENNWLFKRNIISIVLYIIGLVLIFVSFFPFDSDSWILIVAGVLFCGVFNGIAGFRTASKAIEEDEAKHGAEYILDENGIHKNNHIVFKIVFFVLGTVLGVIITPICVISNFKTRKYNKAEIAAIYRDIEIIQVDADERSTYNARPNNACAQSDGSYVRTEVFCAQCGTKNRAGSVFCKACGQKLTIVQ